MGKIERQNIFKGTIILCFFYLMAKLLSFSVEFLIASRFGASIDTDAYYLADGVLFAISPMMTIGIWKVFMPEYKILVVNNNIEEAEQLAGNLLLIFGILSFLLCIFLFLFSNDVIKCFAPGFDYERQNVSSVLLKAFLPVLVFGTLATIPSAILQSQSQFSKSQIKELIVFSVPLIFLILCKENTPIIGLAMCMSIGYASAMVVLFFLAKNSLKISFHCTIFNSRTITILKLYPIACLNAVILQLNSVIDRMFCSTLAVGAITYLNYGTKVINLFNGVFSTTISVAVFPHLSELFAKNDDEKFRSFLKNYISLLICILVPFSAFLFVMSEDIVSLLFGYGKFDVFSINSTATVLKFYATGLLAMGCTTAFNDVLYINKRVKCVLNTTIINIVCNVVLDFIFIGKLGVAGLCLATSISLYITLFIRYYYIKDLFAIDKTIIYNMCSVFISMFCACTLFYYAKLFVHLNTNELINIIVGFVVLFLTYILLLTLISNFYKTKILSLFFRRISYTS